MVGPQKKRRPPVKELPAKSVHVAEESQRSSIFRISETAEKCRCLPSTTDTLKLPQLLERPWRSRSVLMVAAEILGKYEKETGLAKHDNDCSANHTAISVHLFASLTFFCRAGESPAPPAGEPRVRKGTGPGISQCQSRDHVEAGGVTSTAPKKS